LPAKTKELFTNRFGIPILQGYGQSETGQIALSHYDDVVQGKEPAGSVGRVLKNVSIRIAGSDGHPLPNGLEGEIQVRTGEAADPLEQNSLPLTADGYIRTGDMGRMDDDGFLWVTGRLTEKMVVGGFNVFPAEIEEVLRRSPLVRDAVVVGLPDDRLGERPVAGIVWGDTADPEALDRFARHSLAAYKIPRAWFDLEQLPLTDRGKVDRTQAVALAQSLLGIS
jgi:long-chain acyl-CoA synthetase